MKRSVFEIRKKNIKYHINFIIFFLSYLIFVDSTLLLLFMRSLLNSIPKSVPDLQGSILWGAHDFYKFWKWDLLFLFFFNFLLHVSMEDHAVREQVQGACLSSEEDHYKWWYRIELFKGHDDRTHRTPCEPHVPSFQNDNEPVRVTSVPDRPLTRPLVDSLCPWSYTTNARYLLTTCFSLELS